MQKVTREILAEKAKKLLSDNTVDRVLGWKKGEFSYDLTPAVFKTPEEIDAEFVFDDFCGANFSKYLVSETAKSENKVLVFLKPCDTYSFNQLLNEHRFNREMVYAVAVPCDGMIDINKLKASAEGIVSVDTNGDDVCIHTLYEGEKVVSKKELLAERCANCKSKKPVVYDELIGEEGDVIDSNRFDQVEMIEKMTEDERFAFWQNELSRCIRCNACRNVCPACTCEKCVFDNDESGVANKAPANTFEEKMFHIIRAFHVAGRCTDCGECSRVCPENIPIHLLNRKFIKDINSFYGDYQAGESVGQRGPLNNFSTGDPEPGDAVNGGNGNA